MHTPGVDQELQMIVRNSFPPSEWFEISQTTGISLKSVQYNLNPALGREVTFHFIGLLAVFYSRTWIAISKEWEMKL